MMDNRTLEQLLEIRKQFLTDAATNGISEEELKRIKLSSLYHIALVKNVDYDEIKGNL